MPRRATSTSFGGKSGNTRGKGPPKGQGGANPETFRVRMGLIASRERTAKNLEKILDNAKHPQFMKALEFTADRGFGKVQQSVDLTSKGEKVSGVVVLPAPAEEVK